MSRTAVSERLEQWLREAGVAFEILEHTPVRTSEEAARVRGTRLGQGAKALVVGFRQLGADPGTVRQQGDREVAEMVTVVVER